MKKILLLAFLGAFISCTNQETAQTKTEPASVDKLFKPTYTDNFKIGDPENILIVEKMHQGIISKNFEMVI